MEGELLRFKMGLFWCARKWMEMAELAIEVDVESRVFSTKEHTMVRGYVP
jgi:hypothetical protein